MISEPETQAFTDFGLKKTILHDLAAMGYVTPTPVQARCIPPALEGRDVIGLAQTGTGKTAAFGLPIIQHVAHEMEMRALVLAPTRELAQQITAALRDLGRTSGLRVAIVVGGIPIKEDYKALRAWPNVLVATPGRLLDHIHSRTVSLADVQMIAVDEADRMYDMGFMPQIEGIMEVLPPKRQTFMFTATMPAQVERLVRRHMTDPVRIQVGLTAPPRRAEQRLHLVQESDKMRLLLDLLGESEGRVLVFVRTKVKVDRVAREVARRHRVARIHGDREQKEREAAMLGFRTGACRILIATDIAARGIDVADIEHVINFDFPRAAEDYVHRIGRTARIGAAGLATSFVTSMDRQCLAQVERLIAAKLPVTHFGAPRSSAGGIQPRDVHAPRAAAPSRHPSPPPPTRPPAQVPSRHPSPPSHVRSTDHAGHAEHPSHPRHPSQQSHPDEVSRPRHPSQQSHPDDVRRPRHPSQQSHTDDVRRPRHPSQQEYQDEPRRPRHPSEQSHPDDVRRPRQQGYQDEARRPHAQGHPDDVRRPSHSSHPDDVRRPRQQGYQDDPRRPHAEGHPDDVNRPRQQAHPDDVRRPRQQSHPDDVRGPSHPSHPDHPSHPRRRPRR
mgnify:CR=1 FL=1